MGRSAGNSARFGVDLAEFTFAMPAFLRMPIVYVGLVLIVLLVGTFSVLRSSRSEERWIVSSTVNARPEPSNRKGPAPKQDDPVEPGRASGADKILRTPDGLRRKVLVTELGLVCRSAPVGGVPVGRPLDYFSIHFVYGESPEQAGRFQIGPREGPVLGWVPKNAVLEWNSRLMARPTSRHDRPPLVIYREPGCLLDAMAGRTCPHHKGGCPIEGEELAASNRGEESSFGLPILTSKEIPQPDRSTRTIYQVASLVRDQAPYVPPETPPPDWMPDLRKVYIAFVIDTTASMQASIDAARQAASTLVAEASKREQGVTLRLGLVEFRDASPVFGFRVRIVTDFTDPTSFRKALDRVEAASRGDGSVDEAVLDGVALALPARVGEPAGAKSLGWPTGREADLATKMLVLLGDSPDHDQDLERVHALARQARDAKITVAAVSIDRKNYLRGDEPARYRAQWHALAENSYRPADPDRDFAGPIAPVEATLGDATDQIAARLEALIRDRVKHALSLAALAEAEAEGKLVQYTNRQGLTMDQVAPVLADLHRGESKPIPRRDPRFEGRKAPSVRKGWIAAQWRGVPLVELELLMSRQELALLIQELTELQRAVQGTTRDLTELLRIGNAAVAGETTFLSVDRGDQTIAEHMRRRRELPPPRSESLLRRSQTDLLQADELFRAALEARLRSSLTQLIQRLHEDDWNDPRRTIDGMALVPYAPIDF